MTKLQEETRPEVGEYEHDHDFTTNVMGAISVHETEQTHEQVLTPEISAERQATFVDMIPGTTYLALCGDDRELTVESAEQLAENYEVESPDTSLRYLGGVMGIARVAAVTIVAEHGIETLAKFGNSFVDFVSTTTKLVEATSNVKLAAHSARDNEGNGVAIDHESDMGLGCAYAHGIGTVTDLNSNRTIIDLTVVEQPKLLPKAPLSLDQIAEANRLVGELFFGDDPNEFHLGRKDYQELDAPVGIVEGQHNLAADAVAVENFHIDKVSNPRMANKNGVPYYDNDVTQVAKMIMQAFGDIKLSPAVMFQVMDGDIRAVREALASGEGLHADSLKLERYGDPEAAIAYLESLDI